MNLCRRPSVRRREPKIIAELNISVSICVILSLNAGGAVGASKRHEPLQNVCLGLVGPYKFRCSRGSQNLFRARLRGTARLLLGISLGPFSLIRCSQLTST